MKNITLWGLLLIYFAPLVSSHAQTAARYEISGSGAPTGNCTVTGSGYSRVYVDRVTGNHYNCVGTAGTTTGTWTLNGNVAAGIGTVTTSGTPASPQLAKFSSATAITTATATDVSTPLFCSDAGSTDTYACSLAPAPASYVVGTHLRFFANTANTGAASINFNALGALTIVKVAGGITTTLADNDIRAGQWVDGVIATGSNFQIQSTLGNAPPAGITNSAAATVLMKSDGTNAVGSDASNPSAGVIQIGGDNTGQLRLQSSSTDNNNSVTLTPSISEDPNTAYTLVFPHDLTNGVVTVASGQLAFSNELSVTTVTATTITATNFLLSDGNTIATPVKCSNTAASTAITGTASKTYFNINCGIGANLLSAGKTIKLEARGIYSAAAANTLTQTVDLCTVSGCGSGTVVQLAATAAATPGLVTNQGWLLDENTNIFTAGATGTADTQGYAAYQTAALVITFDPTPNTGTATIDTTVNQFLSISVTWSSNSASNTITLRNLKAVIQ